MSAQREGDCAGQCCGRQECRAASMQHPRWLKPRPPVRTMQMPVLEGLHCETSIHKMRRPISAPGQVGLASFGRLTLPIIPDHITAQWE
ncbi:hypothetical protein ACVIYH_007184 [Bradyrhizobium diazoefficiens]